MFALTLLQQHSVLMTCPALYKMISNKFLQRFEGKIQIVGKGGIQGLFGAHSNTTVHTNTHFYPQSKNKTATSLHRLQSIPSRQADNKASTNYHLPKKESLNQKETLKMPSIYQKKQESSAIQVEQINPHESKRANKEHKQQINRQKEEVRKPTFIDRKPTNYSSRSLEKKKEGDWSKSGGLGANIGGEEWLAKKTKLDKIQVRLDQPSNFQSRSNSQTKISPKYPGRRKEQDKKSVVISMEQPPIILKRQYHNNSVISPDILQLCLECSPKVILNLLYLLIMIKQRAQSSKVEQYHFHNHQPIEKSIYLSKEGNEIPHPFSHRENPNQRTSANNTQGVGFSNIASRDKRLTISQINTQKESHSLWDIFKCCQEDTTVRNNDYDDCYVCNRRVFHTSEVKHPEPKEDTPYTSAYRMRSRQQQPIQVFYDKLKNHELGGERWSHQ